MPHGGKEPLYKVLLFDNDLKIAQRGRSWTREDETKRLNSSADALTALESKTRETKGRGFFPKVTAFGAHNLISSSWAGGSEVN